MDSRRMDILKKANGLTSTEIEEIMELYYSGEKLKDIKQAYPINDIQLSELYLLFPPRKLENKFCMHCSSNLFEYREPRDKSAYYKKEAAFCTNCGHIDNASCDCPSCIIDKKDKEELEIKRKRDFLSQKIDFENYIPIKFEDLTFKQKVYLGTFLRGNISKDFLYIHPFNDYKGKLFPTEDYLQIAFRELYYNHIIQISPLSEIRHFTPDYDKNTYSFSWKSIIYQININTDEKNYDDMISSLLNPEIEDDIYTEDARDLWREINYWDSIELLLYRLNAYGLDYSIGKETKAFFENVIEIFPISQIYALIWNAAKNAVAYHVESHVSKKQAANSVLSRMRNAADKIIAGQWNRYDYDRPVKDCPQSLVSEYFFNSRLKICDKAWYLVPHNIKNL